MMVVIAEKIFLLKDYKVLLHHVLLISNIHKAIVFLVNSLGWLLLKGRLLGMIFESIKTAFSDMKRSLSLDLSIMSNLAKVSRTKYLFGLGVSIRI